MSQQIASLFGSLGFKVDTKGLDLFKSKMSEAKTELAQGARATNMLARKFRSLSNSLDGVNSRLDKISIKKANGNISASYEGVAKSVNKIDTALGQIVNRQPTITRALGKINSSVVHGERVWSKYRTSVVAVKDELSLTNARMAALRANSSVRLSVSQSATTPRAISQPTHHNPINAHRNNSFMQGGAGFGGGFFRSMLPATALAGGLTSVGYATKEVVQRGRDQQRMENILLFSSKGLEDFNESLAYVRKEAMRLGLDSAELGRAFAQVNMSAGDKLSDDQKKKMFTDMSEFIMTTGAGKEDQKLIFKAINQMFSLGRIQAEELNQLTERGIPRAMIYNTAMEVFGVKSHSEVMKLQEKGLLDPAKLLPVVFEKFAKQAHDSGAFDKMAASSQTKQNQASEAFSQLSREIMEGGLDAALAKLFTSLSDLVEVLREMVAGFRAVKGWLDEVTDGNSAFSIVLMLIVTLLFRKRKAVAALVTQGQRFSKLMQFITAFLNGRMGQALLLLIKRFGFVGIAITSVLTLFKAVGSALKRDQLGEWTWIDTLLHMLERLGLAMQLVYYRKMLLLKQAKETVLNPWDANFGERTVIGQSVAQQSELGRHDIPNRNAAVNRQADQQRNRSYSENKGIPFSNPVIPKFNIDTSKLDRLKNMGSHSQSPDFSPKINIYVDGVKRDDAFISAQLT